MTYALAGLLWLAGLLLALTGAEVLVRTLTSLGRRLHFTAALVGLLVAFGADGPEITSALAASIQGNRQIGLGVILGSNIYNLAGLLGLSAVLAGYVVARHRFVGPSEALNIVVCLLLAAILFAPGAHLLLAAILLAVLAGYAALTALHSRASATQAGASVADKPRIPSSADTRILVAGATMALALVVGGSELLVNTSTYLGPRLGIPSTVIGTFVLAIGTSLPNTWAAISLARRHLSAEAIATTFNSNSINIAVGIGVPALAGALTESADLRALDLGWLLGMTFVAMAMLALRPALSSWEGSLLIALYAGFVVVRLAAF